MEKRKQGSKRRKRQGREQEAGEMAGKGVYVKRSEDAVRRDIQVDLNAAALPRSGPSWIGRSEHLQPPLPSKPAAVTQPTGLSGMAENEAAPTQAEIDGLVGEPGFSYVNWGGRVSIRILDSHRRVIALLGGMPRDASGYTQAMELAAEDIEREAATCVFTHGDIHHRRATSKGYAALHTGISFGGGQRQPGNLANSPSNTAAAERLLQSPHIKRIAGFTNCLFQTFAPMLWLFYCSEMRSLQAWGPWLAWNFVGSVFAACTFNLGPFTATRPHLDFANLAWGWCAVTALGKFDCNSGGHLILWDLRLLIRFPPGEKRFSVVQYTAGGLFRFLHNGCKTYIEETPMLSAQEAEFRWKTGISMFAVAEN
ncbi:unnamed protein product [Mycena citricolor]|uniref:Uncharacterized protein n=1 Tax=Mycena citricolor TaxID=2018698 RepID=A0AAD2H217_9AGAR|nr:unnamed protein product [Mycena citricolor]